MDKICPKCGKKFECTHDKNCFCMRYKLKKETLEELKQFSGCLCEDCLKTYADKPTDKSR